MFGRPFAGSGWATFDPHIPNGIDGFEWAAPPGSPRVRNRRVVLRSSALTRGRVRRSKPDSRHQPRKLPSRFVFASVGYGMGAPE